MRIIGVFKGEIDVTPLTDSLVEGFERVHVTLSTATTYHVAPQGFEAQLFIEDAAPVISVVAADPYASEAPSGTTPDTAQFVFTRTGNITSSATASYIIDTSDPDSAEPGVDYEVAMPSFPPECSQHETFTCTNSRFTVHSLEVNSRR